MGRNFSKDISNSDIFIFFGIIDFCGVYQISSGDFHSFWKGCLIKYVFLIIKAPAMCLFLKSIIIGTPEKSIFASVHHFILKGEFIANKCSTKKLIITKNISFRLRRKLTLYPIF